MRTFSLLRGIQLTDLKKETTVSLEDIYFDSTGKVYGYLVRKNRWKHPYFLPIQRAEIFPNQKERSLYKQELTLEMDTPHLSSLWTASHTQNFLLKEPIVQGEETAAVIEEVYFSENLSTLVAIEATEGFFADMLKGHFMIYCDQPISINHKPFFTQSLS